MARIDNCQDTKIITRTVTTVTYSNSYCILIVHQVPYSVNPAIPRALKTTRRARKYNVGLRLPVTRTKTITGHSMHLSGD